ncbi:hypothetical protein K466DRAFT_587881 [Polyporus arcularius HHB13444]|uniref:F-box domain-containing protein n=1 Tax=Polyporus arcularius HHB13444 TaxID=1314778 RepID=A0A5C3PIE5_9APHY|nr:hypothetical protein K466DRAFT_587881 [Polyporus arcularius HHB13444]
MDSSAAHQDAGTYNPTVQERVRTRFAGLTPAQVQEMVPTAEEEYRAEIEVLEACLRELGSIRNAGATINATLPPEVLMHVFRCFQPTDRQCIRIAHVCRLWRSLLRNTPEFWVCLLDPLVGGTLTSTDERHGSVVSDMVRNSSPVRFRIGLVASFTAALGERGMVGDLSRLSSICLFVPSGSTLDSFNRICLPNLDTLSIWCTRGEVHRWTIPPTASSRFPRLSALETNCASMARRFVSPCIRKLSVGSSASLVCDLNHGSGSGTVLTCCRANNVQEVLRIMQECPMLEVLRFSGALPTLEDEFGTMVHMPHLRALTIVDGTPHVHMLLMKCISIPATTRLCYEVQQDEEQDPSTAKALPPDVSFLPMLPSLDEAELCIRSSICTTDRGQVCYLRGLAKGIEGLYISVPARKGRKWRVAEAFFNIARILESSVITTLTVHCYRSSAPLSEDNVLWIMNTFRHLRDLTVHGPHQQSLLIGLDRVEPNILVELRRLELGSRDPEPRELEDVVCAIAFYATRGLRLDAFSYLYLNDGRRSTFNQRFGIDDADLRNYRARLAAVAGTVNLAAGKRKLPTVPKL